MTVGGHSSVKVELEVFETFFQRERRRRGRKQKAKISAEVING